MTFSFQAWLLVDATSFNAINRFYRYTHPYLATDQIVRYLWEGGEDAWKAPAAAALPPADFTELNTLATRYLNTLTKIEFQNDRIADLVEELVAQRARGPAGLREVRRIKLDLSDRKSRRFFLQKERSECAAPLSVIINRVQLARVAANAEAAAAVVQPTAEPGKAGRVTAVRRRKKRFTDDELSAILKD